MILINHSRFFSYKQEFLEAKQKLADMTRQRDELLAALRLGATAIDVIVDATGVGAPQTLSIMRQAIANATKEK